MVSAPFIGLAPEQMAHPSYVHQVLHQSSYRGSRSAMVARDMRAGIAVRDAYAGFHEVLVDLNSDFISPVIVVTVTGMYPRLRSQAIPAHCE